MSWLLEPYRDPATYRAILYLLLGLPLGIVGFVIVVTGLSLGLGLAVTLLGVPVLVATFLIIRSLARFERGMAVSLLDAPMPRFQPDLEGDGFWLRRLRQQVGERRTWLETAYLLLRLPMGIADFVFVVTLLSLAFSAAIAPIMVTAGVPTTFGTWEVDSYGEALIFVPISLVYLLVGPRVVQAWSALSRRLSTALLGQLGSRQLKTAVAEVLSRAGSADAFTILDQLELKLGRGAFLTPTRVEATLVALESSGHLQVVDRAGARQYTLA